MKINKYHGKYNIQPRHTAVKYIVVHYTGSGTSKAGSALANCQFFSRGDRQASAHYFIDDSGIWEYADPDAYFTWHCGDGHGTYGITNANSVGIEVCMNGDHPYTETEIGYLHDLVTYLMRWYNLPASRVVRHFDASRKMCPYYYAKRPAEWEKLRARITSGTKVDTSKPAAAPATKKAQTITQVAQDVIDGKYGNGDARKAKLRSLGYDYDAVQAEVNRILSGSKPAPAKSVSQVAQDVINGKYGNGDTRKAKLQAAGYNYDAVQAEVNRILTGKSAPAKKGYTGAWPTLPRKGYIAKGDRGPETRKLQLFLRWYGTYTDSIDGSAGPNTDKAIRAYQRLEHLTVDGMFGPGSLAHAKTVKK